MPHFDIRHHLAVAVVVYIAQAQVRVLARDISEQLGLANRVLEPTLQRLSEGGIVKSFRGPKGGYILAKKPSTITFMEILEAVSDKEELTPSDCNWLNIVGQKFSEVERICIQQLRKITVSSVIEIGGHTDRTRGPAPPTDHPEKG